MATRRVPRMLTSSSSASTIIKKAERVGDRRAVGDVADQRGDVADLR